MKKGCLFLLFVWVAVAGAYGYFLRETEIHHMWWIPILFGLGAAMIMGNIQGIFLALKQKKASRLSPHQWKDGDYVVTSGRISATRSPISAPFSGTPSCIVEYELKRGDNPAGDYMGFLMTPSVIMTNQGSAKIVGFPMLAEITGSPVMDDEAYTRAGLYFSQCKFEKKATNPFTLISQLNAVLADDDGEVKADFCDSKATLHQVESTNADEISQEITERILDSGYRLEETLIKHGDEVTVSGTYRQAKQAIDIGSGIKNITHSLKLGSVSASTSKLLTQSIITIIIIGGIFLGGNWIMLKQLGIDPQELINSYSQKVTQR